MLICCIHSHIRDEDTGITKQPTCIIIIIEEMLSPAVDSLTVRTSVSHTGIPRVQFLPPPFSFSFLIIHILKGKGEGSGVWVSATHVGVLGWVLLSLNPRCCRHLGGKPTDRISLLFYVLLPFSPPLSFSFYFHYSLCIYLFFSLK